MYKGYNRWFILVASVFANISVGGGYAWSVFVEPLTRMFGWSSTDLAFAYTINLAIVPIPLLLGAKFLKLFGERRTILIGGLIYSLGFFATGWVNSLPMLYITYGIITGLGANMANAGVLSNMAKFFPDKSGLALGLVLAGLSTGALILAPIAAILIAQYEVLNTFKIIGTCTIISICLCTLFIKNAPANHKMVRPELEISLKANEPYAEKCEKGWKEMFLDPRYYFIVLMFLAAVFTGVMIISSAAPMGQTMYSLSPGLAALFVGVIAAANGTGRIVGGSLNDRLGSINVFRGIYIITFISLLALVGTRLPAAFALAMFGVGIGYGSSIVTITSVINKYFGTKHFSKNFGLTYFFYSVAAYFAPRIAAKVKVENHGDYTKAFYVAIIIVLIGLVLSFIYGWVFRNRGNERQKVCRKAI